MNNIDPKLLTKENLAKAVTCKTPEDIIALAKENGVELSAEDAKDYLAKLENFDVNISDEDLEKVAGGRCWDICIKTYL
jgi:predicted ribosomally synthesized peptide with nif11-like leader